MEQRLERAWAALNGWFTDITDLQLQESVFLQRRWQIKALLLSNCVLCTLGLQKVFSRDLAMWEHDQYWFRSDALCYSSIAGWLLFLSIGSLCNTRWQKELTLVVEILTAFNVALEAHFFGQAWTFFTFWTSLICYLIFFILLRAHALAVLFFCLELLVMIHEDVYKVLEVGWERRYLGTWEALTGSYVFTSTERVKLALFTAWLVPVAFCYLSSFSHKVWAIKEGSRSSMQASFLNRENAPAATAPTAETTSQPEAGRDLRSPCWWQRSQDRLLWESPMMARSVGWLGLCTLAIWLSHCVALDLLAEISQEDWWICAVSGGFESTFLPCALALALCGLMTSVGHFLVKRFRRVSCLLGKDLPLMVSVCLPSLLTMRLLFSVGGHDCSRPENRVASGAVHSKLHELAILSSLQSCCTLTVASVHPAVLLLASSSLTLMLSACSWGIRLPRSNQHMQDQLLLLVMLQFCLHSIDFVQVMGNILNQERLGSSSLEMTRVRASEVSVESSEGVEPKSQIGELPFEATGRCVIRDIATPMDLLEVRSCTSSMLGSTTVASEPRRTVGSVSSTSRGSTGGAGAFRPAVAVLRHGEREDAVWNSQWFQSEDALKHPYDCPITAEGVQQARAVADSFVSFSNFGIVVASPYLRCVQTAVIIAERMGLTVLLDHELGEVFGRSVFSDMQRFRSGEEVPWRRRRELYETIHRWKPSGWNNSKLPVEHVCWRRILGKAPEAGETLSDARRRYARRFVTYLARSRYAEKNLVVVSHGHMMEACLKVLPSTSSQRVASVPYCGGFMAQLYPNAEQSEPPEADEALEVTAEDTKEPSASFEDGDGVKEKETTSDGQLHSAQLAWWDVKVFGVDLRPTTSAASDQSRKKFLSQLQVGRLTWEDMQGLLGELPDSQLTNLPKRLRAESGASAATNLTNATDSSMYLFKRPADARSVCFSEVSADDASKSLPSAPARESPMSLQSNPLLNRRAAAASAGEANGNESEPSRSSPAEGDAKPISLQSNALLSRRQMGADDASKSLPSAPARESPMSLQSNPLLNRRAAAASAGEANGNESEPSRSSPAEGDAKPISLQSNALLSRRQKLAEASENMGGMTQPASNPEDGVPSSPLDSEK